LPTIAGSFDRLQQQISSIVAKIDAVPFAGISNDLQASLKSLNKLLKGIDGKVSPQAAATLKSAQNALNKVDNMLAQESSTGGNLNSVLRELTAAAKSLRALGDYLQTDPSALLRGRSADKLPTVDRNQQ
jgi:paraquat-inducible protein B